jgi:hypothetical protein
MRQNHLGHTQEQHEEVMRDRFDGFVWLGLLCVRVKKNCGLKSGMIRPQNKGTDT